MQKDLKTLVSQLPECYQPIFGYPDLSENTSRECEDRFVLIKKIYQQMENYYKRPLRVLDLGCAQGFFCFSLASMGATVTGVDYSKENIAVCNALKLENKNLNIDFYHQSIEDFLKTVEIGEYDLVLGLSVFHHLIYIHGLEKIKHLLKDLSKKVGGCLFEFALKEEPLYWANALPEKEVEIIEDITFFNKLSEFKTHLSDIIRPLYFVSEQFWSLSDSFEKFDYWKNYSHSIVENSHSFSRRYYFSKDYILKFYIINNDGNHYNTSEIENEIHFFENYSCNDYKMIDKKIDESSAYLIIERLQGTMLHDAINENKDYDDFVVISNVLEKLVELENNGLYHNDIRPWNVLLKDDGSAKIIDYGAISKKKQDCSLPHDIYFSFFIFVYETATRSISYPIPFRDCKMTPCSLPAKYQKWALSLWNIPFQEWTFSLMLDMLHKHKGQSVLNFMPSDVFYSKMEDMINSLKLEFEVKIKASEARAKASEARAKASEARANAVIQQLHQVQNSRSWKMTRILRKMNKLLNNFNLKKKIKEVLFLLLKKIISIKLIKSIAFKIKKFIPEIFAKKMRVFYNRYYQDLSIIKDRMTFDDLNEREKEIYKRLKTLITQKKGN